MTMNYTALTNYNDALRILLHGAEGLSPLPEDVGDGTVTLGHGYTFIRKNGGRWEIYGSLPQDLDKLGITLTQEDNDRLKKIKDSLNKNQAGTPAHDLLINDFTSHWCYAGLTPTAAQTLFEADMAHQMEALQQKFVAYRPADGAAIFAGLANTRELVAITSMFYNGAGLVKKALVDALHDGNRAEAWFQIRYGWKESNPAYNDIWAGRRFLESTIFGLYEEAPSDPLADAKDIYSMFTQHRDLILQREDTYQSRIDFVNGYGPYQQALAAAGAGKAQSSAKPARRMAATTSSTRATAWTMCGLARETTWCMASAILVWQQMIKHIHGGMAA